MVRSRALGGAVGGAVGPLPSSLISIWGWCLHGVCFGMIRSKITIYRIYTAHMTCVTVILLCQKRTTSAAFLC